MVEANYEDEIVLLPYEFTLLSNGEGNTSEFYSILLPYEFTLLSNPIGLITSSLTVLLPYEFTLLSNNIHSGTINGYGFTTL